MYATLRTRLFDIRLLNPRQIVVVKAAIWFVALIPFARLAFGAINATLGANPIETITRTTGWYTLVLLCVTLGVTPLRRLAKWPWLARVRRTLGLFAFFYAALHFTTWFWFDHFFDLREMANDIVKRPFITVGFMAFVLLVPLAATSTNAMIRRFGGARWQALHRLVYVIAVLGIVHFWWMRAGKNNLTDPEQFAIVLTLLLGARVWWRWGADWFARATARPR